MDDLYNQIPDFSVHLVKWYFLFCSIPVIFLGILINLFENLIPGCILRSFKYGKQAYKGTTTFSQIEFPKSTFKQFYEVGVLCSLIIYPFVFSTYIFGSEVPPIFHDVLVLCCGEEGRDNILSPAKVFIAMTLITLQIGRRFYDTHFVSIFGKNSKINLTHWLIGITYYPMVILSVLCEAPNFADIGSGTADFNDIGVLEVIGMVLFFWAWWHQHTCTVILANLRNTKKGSSSDYKLPMGDWFQYVSSPHCSAEILMYVALSVFLWENSTWWYVMVWIFGNQTATIVMSHKWYKENFKNFPQNRKALIPYIY